MCFSIDYIMQQIMCQQAIMLHKKQIIMYCLVTASIGENNRQISLIRLKLSIICHNYSIYNGIT